MTDAARTTDRLVLATARRGLLRADAADAEGVRVNRRLRALVAAVALCATAIPLATFAGPASADTGLTGQFFNDVCVNKFGAGAVGNLVTGVSGEVWLGCVDSSGKFLGETNVQGAVDPATGALKPGWTQAELEDVAQWESELGAADVTLPADAAGVVSGTESAGLTGTVSDFCAAAPELVATCVGAAAFGGYELGNKVLGPLLFKLFGWGGSGDDRSVITPGWTAAPTTQQTAGQSSTWTFGFSSGQQLGYEIQLTCSKPGQTDAVGKAFVTGHGNGTTYTQATFTGGCNSTSSNFWCAAGGKWNDTTWSWVTSGGTGCGVFPGHTGTHADSTWAVKRVDVLVPSVGEQSPPAYDLGQPAVVASWYKDPAQQWTYTATETCRAPDGTTATRSSSVTFTPTANGVPTPPALPTCASVLPGSHVEDLTGAAGRTGSGGNELTVNVPTYNNTATTAYPLCTTKVNTASPCYLDLRRNGKSCYSAGAVCAGWMQYESEMACYWGPYSVPIKWCEDDLATKFDTQVAPKPGTDSSGSAGPAALPTTGTNPGTDTDQDGSAEGSGVTDPSGENCMAAAWSWNPVNWVLVPVKCALKWAFVPDAATVTSVRTDLGTKLGASTVAPWLSALTGLFPSGGSGCQGPGVDLPMTTPTQTVYLFDACDQPMATVAAVTKALMTVAVVVVGGYACVAAIQRSFGMD